VSNQARLGGNHVTETITIDTADSAFRGMGLPRVDFMKIDVEGFEPKVIAGARQIIAASKPVVVMEMSHWCLNAFHRTSIPDFLDFMASVFPILYAVDGRTYLDLGNETERHQVTRAHILQRRYQNLVAAFEPQRLERFHARFAHQPVA
jgi:hypothetical protein